MSNTTIRASTRTATTATTATAGADTGVQRRRKRKARPLSAAAVRRNLADVNGTRGLSLPATRTKEQLLRAASARQCPHRRSRWWRWWPCGCSP